MNDALNAVEQSLIDAIDVISKNNVKASSAALTIECTIMNIEDAGLQIYRVKYKDNSFNVTSSSGTYNVGDVVYVLVPEGDFSKPKIILGAVTTSSANLDEDETTEEYIPLSDNLINVGDNNLNLCSWQGTKNENIEIINLASFKEAIAKSIEGGDRTFNFSAKIKTNLNAEQQMGGNYGLQLYLPILKDPGTGEPKIKNGEINPDQETYQLVNIDIHSILGNPYKLLNWSLQTTRYVFNENNEFDNNRDPYLIKFVSNFIYNATQTDYDIFIKDLSFYPIALLSETDKKGYKLTLKTDSGRYFVSNSATTKTITPVLNINGKKSSIGDDYQCYWFVKDDSISFNSKYYLPAISGIGQKCLNTIAEDSSSFVTNIYELKIYKKDIISEAEYQCVLVNNDRLLKAYISIENETSTIVDFNLITKDGNTNYVENIGEVNLIAYIKSTEKINSASVYFQRKDKDGNNISPESLDITPAGDRQYSKEEEGELIYILEKNFTLPVSSIDQQTTIYCSFYNEVGMTIGNRSLTLFTNAEPTWRMAIQNQDVVYMYDADGNSPFSADYAYPNNILQYTTPLTFKIQKEDNTELTDNEYAYCKAIQTIPRDSLFKFDDTVVTTNDYYVIKDKQLEYSIVDVYNASKAHNGQCPVTLNVEFRDKTFTQTVNIKFVKQGEAGTNGSKFTGVIRYRHWYAPDDYVDYGYGDISRDASSIMKLQLAYSKANKQWYYTDTAGGVLQSVGSYNNNKDKDFLTDGFNVTVYSLGEVVDPSTYSCDQELFDSLNTDPVLEYRNKTLKITKERDTETQQITGFKDISATSEFTTVLQAKIKITKTNQNGVEYEETLCAYYPIEVAYLAVAVKNSTLIPHIADGFTKVLYASDGTNPQYDTTNPFRLDNTLSFVQNSNDIYTYQQSGSKSNNLTLRVDSKEPNICKATPTSKFTSAESLNYIKVDLTIDNQELEDELIEKRDKCNKNILLDNKKILWLDKFIPAAEVERPWSTTLYSIFHLDTSNLKFNSTSILELLAIVKDNLNSDLVIQYNRYNTCLKKLELIIENATKAKELSKSNKGDTWYNNFLTSAIGDEEVMGRRRLLWKAAYKDSSDVSYLSKVAAYTPSEFEEEFKKAFIEDESDKRTKKKLKDILTQTKSLLLDFDNELLYLKKDSNKTIYNIFSNIVYYLNEYRFNLPLDEEGYPINELESYAGDLVAFDDIYKELVHRLADPFNGENDNWTGQEELNKQAELYPDSYPLYSTYEDLDALYTKLCNLGQIEKGYSGYSNICELIRNKILEDKTLNENQEADYNLMLESYETASMTIFRPIIMLYNTYELSNITGWDGNKLYIDEENSQYLFAPQLGAGIKDDQNRFTGLVMGLRGFGKDNEKKQKEVGLFGYHLGQQTYFLNAQDGSAIMGKSGTGQIVIDPTVEKGLIYSTSFQSEQENNKPKSYSSSNEAGAGMLIDLSTPEIRFGSGNFSVNADGYLVAKGGGSIGGQKIGNNTLSSIDDNLTLKAGEQHDETKIIELEYGYNLTTIGIMSKDFEIFYEINSKKFTYVIIEDTKKKIISITYQNSNSNITVEGEPIPLVVTGNLTNPERQIQARTPDDVISETKTKRIVDNIGGIYGLAHNKLESIVPGFQLSQNGLSIGSKVKITEDGVMTLGSGAVDPKGSENHQTINGDGSRSYISFGGTEAWSAASSDNDNIAKVYIGTDGISLGKRFSISPKGEITAYSGNIGGQTLTKNSLSADGITISAGSTGIAGSISANYDKDSGTGQMISSGGDAYFNNVHCNNIFTIGDTEKNYQSYDGSQDIFNFGMGNYGSIASGGFNLSDGQTDGTVQKTSGSDKGLYMNPTTTYVKTASGKEVIGTYVGNIVADSINTDYLKATIGDIDIVTMQKVVIEGSGLEPGTFTFANKRVYLGSTTIGDKTIKYLGQTE